MPQALPEIPQRLDPSLDPTQVTRLLQDANASLTTAFHLLQCQAASTTRYETQTQIYLAREAIETALAWYEGQDEEGTHA